MSEGGWYEEGGAQPSGDGSAAQSLQPVKPRKRLSVASVILAILLILATAAGVTVLVRVGVLPTWALVLAVAVDIIVALGLGAMLLLSGPRSHRGRFWVAAVLSVLLMVGNLGVVKVGTDFLRFGQDIQPPATDTILYDVVVQDRGPTEIQQLAGSAMGEVQDDPLSQAVHEKVAELVQVDFVASTPWTSTVAALTGGEVTSMVIEDGYMQVLADANPDAYKGLRILTSFGVDASRSATPPPSPAPSATPKPLGESFIVYISGNDSDKVSPRGRSDVNILMVVNPDTGKVLLVNTPRDYYVQLHGTTGLKDKLTHASTYGIDTSVATLEDLYGISIDYYIRINFTSLVTVVDAIGGVDVDSAYTFSAQGFDFVKGMNHLNGAQALAFSRDRHDFAAGDRVRGENQERVIEAIIKKMSDPMVLVNYPSYLGTIEQAVQTSIPQEEISSLIKYQLSTSRDWDVSSSNVTGGDASEYTYTYPGQKLYVMTPDQASVDAAKAKIQETLTGQ